LPKIAVLATGDELVAVDEIPEPHQIRQSNAYSISAALQRAGYAPRHTGCLSDDEAAARPVVEKLLAENDWLIVTGAASKGGRDFVPALLGELGCRRVFHGVAQRPGKPAGCWVGPADQVVLALPGNPVSALTGLHVFVLPGLAVASGRPLPAPRMVALDGRLVALPDFTRHLPVKLRADGRAEPAAIGNSGDFIGLLRSDGWITVPPVGGNQLPQTAFPYSPWL
jgi:molybdopterin molybdotransferase